jgi:hypothetical protein
MGEILPIVFRGMEKYDIPDELILRIIYEFCGIVHPHALIMKEYKPKTNPLECVCLYININRYNPDTGLRQGANYEVIKCDVCDLAMGGNNIEDEEHELNYEIEMYQCDNCGNIWDGNAQCMCLNY